jgi:DNA polymerase-3 subunit alpha
MFDIEDLDGTVRCIVWPTEFVSEGSKIAADAIVLLQGVLDRRGGDEANLVVNRVILLDEAESMMTSGMAVRIDQARHGDEAIRIMHEILRGYPGNRRLEFRLILEDGMVVKMKSNLMKVDINQQLCQRLEEQLGAGSIEMLT